MTGAFKCDGCGEFAEGDPRRYKLREYGSVGFTGWINPSDVAKAELCGGCAADLEGTVAGFLGGDGET